MLDLTRRSADWTLGLLATVHGYPEDFERALLGRGQFWVEHESRVLDLANTHGVTRDRGKIGDERAEAVDGQAVVGALGCDLARVLCRMANAAGPQAHPF